MKTGIIAIKLREEKIIDVVVAKRGRRTRLSHRQRAITLNNPTPDQPAPAAWASSFPVATRLWHGRHRSRATLLTACAQRLWPRLPSVEYADDLAAESGLPPWMSGPTWTRRSEIDLPEPEGDEDELNSGHSAALSIAAARDFATSNHGPQRPASASFIRDDDELFIITARGKQHRRLRYQHHRPQHPRRENNESMKTTNSSSSNARHGTETRPISWRKRGRRPQANKIAFSHAPAWEQVLMSRVCHLLASSDFSVLPARRTAK
jgi:hypothetical protein